MCTNRVVAFGEMTRSIAIGISAFRSDDAVIDLLDAIFADPHPEVDSVIVVDSLGTGDIATTVAARGWPVVYENSDCNLGSAGNLARRIELAAELGADWCLCLNHDADWSSDRLLAMLKTARSRPNVGAVYPVLDHSPRQPRWEDGRRRFTPSAGMRHADLPDGEAGAEVLWSSSNGALYSTAPLADGIEVMATLWMGYEDLAYGIALHQSGWTQLMCRSAVLSEVFDYGERFFLSKNIRVPIKPVWYSYYNIRNLMLIRKQYGADGISFGVIARKLIQSSVRIILLEKQKVARLRMLYSGVVAGIFGRTGKNDLLA